MKHDCIMQVQGENHSGYDNRKLCGRSIRLHNETFHAVPLYNRIHMKMQEKSLDAFGVAAYPSVIRSPN